MRRAAATRPLLDENARERRLQWPPLRGTIVICLLALAGFLPGSAAGAGFGDTSVRNPTLKVSAGGIALVEYTTQSGLRRHVLVWGAIDGLPHRTRTESAQQRFKMDYSGGWKSRENPRFWRTLRNACSRYDGPRLPFFVAGCKAPDGSYWALQAWQRNLPMRGFAPWTAKQRGVELHVSHWSGELPELQIYRHWTYGRAHQGFFGRLLYRGRPVYGRRTPSATVRDEWARNVYIDTYDSDYGPGWRHDTAIATHPGSGGFCYSFVPQAPPRGYPSDRPNGNGLGERYRISALGPGVTPIVQKTLPRLTRFDATAQLEATRRFDEILGGDTHCAAER
jgi:hypothetical protein